MTEKNKEIQQVSTTDDDLDSEISEIYDAKYKFGENIIDTIVKGNAFWVATEFDDDTGLNEIIILEDSLGKDYCTAYTYLDSTLVNECNEDDDLSYSVRTLGEIYREMIYEQVDYLTIWSSHGFTDIYITELYKIMTDLEGKY